MEKTVWDEQSGQLLIRCSTFAAAVELLVGNLVCGLVDCRLGWKTDCWEKNQKGERKMGSFRMKEFVRASLAQPNLHITAQPSSAHIIIPNKITVEVH